MFFAKYTGYRSGAGNIFKPDKASYGCETLLDRQHPE